MFILDIIIIALLVACLFELVIIGLYDWELKQQERENKMYQRLLADQANLHEMSLNAYIAMLHEAQRHMNKQ